MPGPWYSTEELADILHVDPSTLRRWRIAHPRQGPPYVQMSKRVILYSARDVEHWIAQRRVSPGRPPDAPHRDRPARCAGVK
ncbi:helix-turn-helix domain-containing protein [Streptomyces sp. NPDC051662]|uniref:helix-turn-helix domain-containing protein n=1 Tax=Streptomyces sp. NPDC051662 TaxID=3154750 RepID=UPI003427AAAE